jgi:2-succinyl-5-enolpyruvyl-6-hydroxy-3-cyclohexene-1-carboxylate synthase
LWQKLSCHYTQIIEQALTRENSLNEIELARLLTKIPPHFARFIASSMPIRDADAHFFPKDPIGPVFANRGVSGIDGNVATAIGIAQGAEVPTVALIGDQAFLHDLTSLAQLSSCPYPLILIVVNNGGGGIFSFLPVASEPSCEQFFTAAHNWSFEHAAKLFCIDYVLADTAEALLEAAARGKSCLIEVKTERKANVRLHRELLDNVLCPA